VKLADVQAAFQGAIMADEPTNKQVRALTRPPVRTDSVTGIGIYARAYRVRLSEFIAEDYPALRAHIGEEAFEALVEDYIIARPSHDRNARWYTHAMPDYMQESESWRGEALGISIAQLERALLDASDAPDGAALSIQALAEIAPDRWPNLSFTLHPTVILLDLEAGAVETYIALNDEDAGEARPSPPVGAARSYALVWRAGDDPSYRELDADEYLALNEARAGHAFGDICQMAAFQQGEAMTPERLAQFLTNWFEEELIVALRDEGAANA
jgi:hypothetical protein